MPTQRVTENIIQQAAIQIELVSGILITHAIPAEFREKYAKTLSAFAFDLTCFKSELKSIQEYYRNLLASYSADEVSKGWDKLIEPQIKKAISQAEIILSHLAKILDEYFKLIDDYMNVKMSFGRIL